MPPFPDEFASAQIYFFTFINFGIVCNFQIIVLHVALNFAHHQVYIIVTINSNYVF